MMEGREQAQEKVKGTACVGKQTALICVCRQAREGLRGEENGPSFTLVPRHIHLAGVGMVSSGQALAETPPHCL